MKKITITICAALVFASCNNDDAAKTQVASATTTEATEPMPDSATANKRWMEYMMPGTMHQMMASWDGEWTGEVKFWGKPGAEPTKGTLSTTNKTILNGLYHESTHKGEMMERPFEGRGILAFDNAKKVFISSWIDNMGSGIMSMEGTWDEATKTLNSKGKATDPVRQKDCEMREVFKIVDNDTHLMEMYSQDENGKEFKSMEITFKRKK